MTVTGAELSVNLQIDNSGRRVLILGGSGFIGTRIALLLRHSGASFRIGDIRQSEALPDFWAHCDVRNENSLAEVFGNADAVINLAAEHRDDVRPASRYRETNVLGAEHVCNVARRSGISKLLFTSSVAVYGFQRHEVKEDGPFEPFNHYGRTKLEAELIYRRWAEEDPARTLVIIRPTVVFGEANRGNVHNLMSQIASGRFLMVGAGTNVKSIAYVGNVAAFIIHSLQLDPGIHIFNYVDGPDMTTNELIGHIMRCLDRDGSLIRIPKPLALLAGHVLDGIASITGRSFPISAIRVRKFCETTRFGSDQLVKTGFTRPYSLQEALKKTVEYEFLQR